MIEGLKFFWQSFWLLIDQHLVAFYAEIFISYSGDQWFAWLINQYSNQSFSNISY